MSGPQKLLARPMLALMMFGLLASDCTQSNAQATRFKVGDKVEFEFHGDLCQGTVVDASDQDFIEVRFTRRGIRDSWPFGYEELRLVNSKPSAAPKTKLRIWTSSNGKYKIKASLKSIDGDKVVLLKEDGKENTVPVEKLSAADQGYIEAIRDNYSAQKENPFAMQDGNMSHEEASEDYSDPSVPESGLPIANLKGVKPLVLMQKRNWSWTPDVNMNQAVSDPEPIAIEPIDSDESAHLDLAFVASADGTGMAMSVSDSFEDDIEVRAFDLTTGQQTGSLTLTDEHLGLRSVGSHGKQVVTANDTFYDVDHIAIWSAESGTMKKAGGWRAPEGSWTSGVKMAQLLGEEKLLARGKDGLVIWDIPKRKAIVSCSAAKGSMLAFSANHKQLAIAVNNVIYLVDTETAKQIASFEFVHDFDLSALAFSDDGMKLAGLFTDRLCVWNLTSGKEIKQIQLLETYYENTLMWADNRFLLAGGTLLIDSELGITAWVFKKHHDVKAVFKSSPGQFWYAHYDDKKGFVIPFKLPQSEVKEACESLDPGELDYLEPGPITLDIGNMSVSAGKVRRELSEKLRKAGYTIQDNAPLVLSMYTERREQMSVGVRDFFQGPLAKSNETITYTPQVAYIELRRNDTVLWKDEGHYNVPSTIHLQENESAQQAADRHCRVREEFFTYALIPLEGPILPGGKLSFGESEMGPNGIQ